MLRHRHFDALVERALRRIPQPFQQALENVAIVVEDWPDPELVREITGDPRDALYGLFTGTPLTERSLEYSGDLPAQIHLYRGPLEEDFPDPEQLAQEVEVTLVHEIAHFMGLDEEAVERYGYE
ncbi:MAG: hypothetical protein GKR89_23130 [Candidatus Latescibacteria bacterium]|nr:hypothetical protein [Candidatus Latescibacterota bacterium]